MNVHQAGSGQLKGRICVVGGAGFIGGHLVRRLIAHPSVDGVTVFDNFSSGSMEHLGALASHSKLTVVVGDAADLDALRPAVKDHQVLVHLASNPDIARAVTEPTIDFDQGTRLTSCVIEAARTEQVGLVLYASGSGVYGDLGDLEVSEDYGPLCPVSTYGASKLAGEALLCAYAEMFEVRVRAFRFANVVGPQQTHGVGYDFLRQLREHPQELTVLGDGNQSKSYVYVDDIIDAVMAAAKAPTGIFEVYNVGSYDSLTVKEIARLAIAAAGLRDSDVHVTFTGGRGGWKGDVPVVRLDAARIRGLGWRPQFTSSEAMVAALTSMVADSSGEMGG